MNKLRQRLREARDALTRKQQRETRRQTRLKQARHARDARKADLRKLRELRDTSPESERERYQRRIEDTLIQIAEAEERVHRLDRRLTVVREQIVKLEGQVRRLTRKVRRQRRGGKAAVAWGMRKVGITESPPESNWGPEIGQWIKYTGYSGPVYWCGCFACYAVVKVGKAAVPNRIRLGYTGYIVQDARANVNGLRAVSFADARPGDILVYDFDHIGVFRSISGSTVYTVEGNTSPGSSGHQSNGGGVWDRIRSTSDVLCVARPEW